MYIYATIHVAAKFLLIAPLQNDDSGDSEHCLLTVTFASVLEEIPYSLKVQQACQDACPCFSFALNRPLPTPLCTAGPAGYRTACGLRECGLARFPFWAALRGGRTAVDVLLSDCQNHKGIALYGWCQVRNTLSDITPTVSSIIFGYVLYFWLTKWPQTCPLAFINEMDVVGSVGRGREKKKEREKEKGRRGHRCKNISFTAYQQLMTSST